MEGASRITNDDRLFGYRLQLFEYAERTSVAEACRVFGVHRSTYYDWRRRVERHGLEVLRPRERRRPKMPNQVSPVVEERIVAFALGHPGLGPKRIAAELGRERWGGIVVSPNGVHKALRRHGLNTRAKRLGPDRRLPRPLRAAARASAGSRTSTSSVRANWWAWTASSSAACAAPAAMPGS